MKKVQAKINKVEDEVYACTLYTVHIVLARGKVHMHVHHVCTYIQHSLCMHVHIHYVALSTWIVYK